MEREHPVTRSVWAALCGQCEGARSEALAVLRSPIRRRPYNRGEIITMKREELILINRLLSPLGSHAPCCGPLTRGRGR